MSILVFGKEKDAYLDKAVAWLGARGEQVTVFRGRRTDPFPEAALRWSGNYLLSYLSPWVIPEALLSKASKTTINFHPGPPEYPGIGCTNFALYNQETEFGVTAHIMLPKVDTGEIIAVRRFEIKSTDSVWDLTQRCYEHIWLLFQDLMKKALGGEALPHFAGTWTRRPFLRRELDALCEVKLGMSDEETSRRIRAVTFPGMPGAYLTISGIQYDLIPRGRR